MSISVFQSKSKTFILSDKGSPEMSDANFGSFSPNSGGTDAALMLTNFWPNVSAQIRNIKNVIAMFKLITFLIVFLIIQEFA